MQRFDNLRHRLPRTAVRSAAVSAALVLTIGLAACGSSADDADEANSATPSAASTSSVPPDGAALLGVISAGGGTFADGKLTLTDVDPRGVWFTDRPARQAGTEGIDTFTKRFFAGDDPPNAVVEVAGDASSKNLAVVELSDPAYDADEEKVTFAAKLVPADEPKTDRAVRIARHPGVAEALTGPGGALPATFGATTVFIDDAPVAPVNEQLEALAAEDAKLQPIYQNALIAARIADEKYGQSCFEVFMEDMAEVSVSVSGYVPKQLAQLEADAARNGGQIPSSDQALLSKVEEQLDGASQTATTLPAALTLIKRGHCPDRT